MEKYGYKRTIEAKIESQISNIFVFETYFYYYCRNNQNVISSG